MNTQDQHIVVIGLGKTGYSVVSFFADRGERVIAMDTREQPPFAQNVKSLYTNVELILGGLDQDVLCAAKDKILHKKYKGLSEPVVKEAFSWNDEFMQLEGPDPRQGS